MIDRCFNESCQRPLVYLREGRIVRVVHNSGQKAVLEHFWLCGSCYEEFNFAFPPGGGVELQPKPKAVQSKEFHYGEVFVWENSAA